MAKKKTKPANIKTKKKVQPVPHVLGLNLGEVKLTLGFLMSSTVSGEMTQYHAGLKKRFQDAINKEALKPRNLLRGK